MGKEGNMSRETFRIEIPIEVQDKTDPGVSQATKKIMASIEPARELKNG